MTAEQKQSLKYWMLRILRWEPKTIFFGILLAGLTAVSGIALLMLSGWFITASAVTGLAIALGLVAKLDIYLPGSGIRFFALSRTVGRYAERLYNHNAVLTLIASIRQQLFAGLISLPNNDIKQTQNSEWLSRLTADLDSLDNILLNMLIPPAVGMVVTLLIGLFLSFFWPAFALYFVVLLVLICAVSSLLNIKVGQSDSYQTAQLLNHARSQAIEHLQGQLVLKSMAANQQHQQHLLQTIAQFGELQNRLKRRLEHCQLLHSVVLSIALIFFCLMAFYGFQQDYFSGPMAVLIILACIGVIELLQNLPSQFSQWGKTTYAAQRLQPLAQLSSNDHRLAAQDQPASSTPTNEEAGFSCIRSFAMHLSKHPYIPASCESVIDINLGLNDKLLVLGKSGRGKSTLSELLSGQANVLRFSQAQCTILLNEQMLTHTNIAHWQNQIGYLSQQNTILADTLYANLTLGMPNLSSAEIFAALDKVALSEWVRSLPQQLDTWLGDTGNQLSGGQARRICLARLVLKSPQFLLLDEPFNGVDSNMAATIWTNLSPWLQDKCVVLLMHEKPAFWQYTANPNRDSTTLIL
ncbi:MAG: ATP-binding cassette domain-containing protein [Paraglaciecola sp.]|nr:ATP-binding cassette domain-containing protein [Paraglaciecola sp.]NCT46470.1 ATP-binding cassette domain-containing protein [Paraglaciecola sp.]